MEITWLPPHIPQSRNRARALRACPDCHRKKKRCRHVLHHSQSRVRPLPGARGANNVDQSATDVAEPAMPQSDVALPQSRVASPASASAAYSRPERFVGDLNPEAVIRERLDGQSDNPLRDRIGLWITSHEENREGLAGVDSSADQPFHPDSAPGSTASFLHQRYMSAMKACDRVPLKTLENLVPIYFSRVNHILPLVDRELFLQSHSQGTQSVFLERAICLVAAKYKVAGLNLYLVPDGRVVTSRQFCSDVYHGLVVAMNAGLETDRVTRIRILALMSLHCEGYDGAEAASMHLCQAIHQAQTAGLHLDRPGVAEDSLSKLFWCLWTLDKMHASLGGRPVLLADRDIGIEKPGVETRRSRSAFDVWFVISDLLSTVISLYRPSADDTTGWEEGFPTFEETVGDDTQELDFTTLGFLELYYHSVSILSCRSNLSGRPDASKPSYIRQGLAAVRIYSIVAFECSHDLPPLPIVPYGVTLSMGVSYQQFRSSKLITHSNRARADLANCCSLLEELSAYWFSAEAMARLGQKALHQIDTKLDHVRAEEGRQQESSGNEPASIASYNPSDIAPSGEDHRNFNDKPSTTTQDSATFEAIEPLPGAESGQDGFADIDMLFGDFLDLSLPTNFWDPVFSTEDHGEHGE